MSKDNLLSEFIANLREAIDLPEKIVLEEITSLEELPEWDSVAMLGTLAMYEMKYGKEVSTDDIYEAKTVGDLYKLAN